MTFDTEWNVSKKMMCFGLTILALSASNPGYAQQIQETPPGEDNTSQHLISGTLDQLDFDTKKGLLKTDLGKPIFFEIVRPELFRRLSVGQHVTIGMNEQGQAVKVMELPPVELPVPPTGNK